MRKPSKASGSSRLENVTSTVSSDRRFSSAPHHIVASPAAAITAPVRVIHLSRGRPDSCGMRATRSMTTKRILLRQTEP